jgi:glycosyltransferase involved in cell wall biosynthesis
MSLSRSEILFVVFSDDWGVHPSSSQHLFRRIMRRHPVLWVNTIGMRAPTLSVTDLRKMVSKGWRMLRGTGSAQPVAGQPEGLVVCQPFMLPFSGLSMVRSLNRGFVRRALDRHLAQWPDARRRILVSSVPNACDFVDAAEPERVVYYCVDDFSQWPGLDHALVKQMESRLIQRADLLLATSDQLHRKLAGAGKRVVLFTHGVDLDLFSSRVDAEHRVLAGIARPRVGYFGLIDARSNLELLEVVAQRMPEVAFVMAGPQAADAALERIMLPNVHYVGPIVYEHLPSLIHGLDVLMLPYRVNDFTATLSPLKLKEYLATGKPVISSPLPEAMKFRGSVLLASTAEQWQAALQSVLQSGGVRGKIIPADLRHESWESKADHFLSLITEPADC